MWTWQFDAKNCGIVYYRIIKHQVHLRRLRDGIGKWASMLLMYSRALNFNSRTLNSIYEGRPTLHQGYTWIIRMLEEIHVYSTSPRSQYEFRRHTTTNTREAPEGARCCLTGAKLDEWDRMIRYAAGYGTNMIVTPWLGWTSYDDISTKIERALRKHSKDYSTEMVKKMKERYYGERDKIRIGPGR